jgi:hypothetical protein
VGDLDARYLGGRATLEPLFASYGARANSDYYPVLDLNAARHRFMEKSATDVVALLNLGVPVLELLEPGFARRPMNPLHMGAYSFERIENARQAAYARDFLLRRPPPPQGIPMQLQKDLEVVKLRLLECRDAREFDVWLHSLLHVAKLINQALPPAEAGAVWSRIAGARCVPALHEFQRQWIALFQAVGARRARHGGARPGAPREYAGAARRRPRVPAAGGDERRDRRRPARPGALAVGAPRGQPVGRRGAAGVPAAALPRTTRRRGSLRRSLPCLRGGLSARQPFAAGAWRGLAQRAAALRRA